MKSILFLLLISIGSFFKSFGQKIAVADLVGTWDQHTKSHAATIIFDDTARVRFSYKGHSGSTRKYYYLLNSDRTPALLTVDYRANHKRHRNEYLIQLLDKNTMKLQVLYKKDDRTHFNEGQNRIITLTRRLDL